MNGKRVVSKTLAILFFITNIRGRVTAFSAVIHHHRSIRIITHPIQHRRINNIIRNDFRECRRPKRLKSDTVGYSRQLSPLFSQNTLGTNEDFLKAWDSHDKPSPSKIAKMIVAAEGAKSAKSLILKLIAHLKQQPALEESADILIGKALCVALQTLSKPRERHRWQQSVEIFQLMESQTMQGANLVAYNALLNTLRKAKKLELVLLYFEKLKSSTKGLTPDSYSYSAVIRALADNGQVSECFGLLEKMENDGMEPNNFIYTSVLVACQKTGDSQRALAVIEEMMERGLTPDHITYSAAISACEKGRNVEGALYLMDSMKQQGIEPNEYTYTAVIRACSSNPSMWRKGIQLLHEMDHPTISVFNAAISTCASSGQFEEACHLFQLAKEQKLKPDRITFNSMINACEKAMKYEEAILLLKKMKSAGINPDTISYNSAINACGNSNRPYEAMKLFERMKQDNLKIDHYSYNILLAAFARNGDLAKVVEILREMLNSRVKPDEISYLHAINAARLSQQPEAAFKFFTTMKKAKLKPSKQIFTSLINVCGTSKCSKKSWQLGPQRAMALLNEMEQNGFKADVYAYSGCLSVLAMYGKAQESIALLKRMQENGVAPNKYTFSSVMKACAKVQDWTGVIDIYKETKENIDGTLDLVVYQALLWACAELGEAKFALEIVNTVPNTPGIDNPSVDFYNLALKSCEAKGDINIALDILALMEKNQIKPDIISYNRAIAACQESGAGKQAIRLLQRLKLESTKPNVFTFTAIMKTCIHGNSSSSVVDDLLSSETDESTDAMIYTAAIQAYHSFGMYDKAAALYETAAQRNLMGTEIRTAVIQGMEQNDPAIVVDFHGLVMPVANAAIRFTINQVWQQCQKTQKVVKPIEIVTGIGKHSSNQFEPTLRPEIQRMLVEEFYPPLYTSTKPGNSGRVVIGKDMINEWIIYNIGAKKVLMKKLSEILQQRLFQESQVE